MVCRFTKRKCSLIFMVYFIFLVGGGLFCIGLYSSYTNTKELKAYSVAVLLSYESIVIFHFITIVLIFIGALLCLLIGIFQIKWLTMCLGLVEIGVIIFSIVILSNGSDINEMASDVESTICTSSQSYMAKELRKAYNDNLNILCTSSCRCTYDQNGVYGGPSGYAKRIENCDNWETNVYNNEIPKQEILDFIGKLEEKEDCSGICDQRELFYFSDVTNGIPKTTCKEYVSSYMKNHFILIIVSCAFFIFEAVVTIMLIFFYLCTKEIDDKVDQLPENIPVRSEPVLQTDRDRTQDDITNEQFRRKKNRQKGPKKRKQ